MASNFALLIDEEAGLQSAHQGPVWALSWSHPKYESLLATAGYDRIIKIWKKSSNGWRVIFRH